MDENKYLIMAFALSSIFFCNLVYAPPVLVSVSGKMQATVDYFNYTNTLESTPLDILTHIENMGSASCMTKVRADIYDNSSLIRTTWSDIYALEPGDHHEFHNYWIPTTEGRFWADVKIYHCNEIFDYDNVSFSVSNSNISQTGTVLLIGDASSTERSINITLISNKTLEDVVIIPSITPLGWIVEPEKIALLEGGVETPVSISYDPGIWHDQSVSFDVVSLDGSDLSKFTLAVAKEENSWSIEASQVIWLLTIIIAGLAIEIFRLRSAVKPADAKHGKKQSETI